MPTFLRFQRKAKIPEMEGLDSGKGRKPFDLLQQSRQKRTAYAVRFCLLFVLVHNGHDDRHHYQLRFGRDLLFPAEGVLPSHEHFLILPGLRFRGTPVFFAP